MVYQASSDRCVHLERTAGRPPKPITGEGSSWGRFWLNILLALLFVCCWAGIPLWLTLTGWRAAFGAKHAGVAAKTGPAPVFAQPDPAVTHRTARPAYAGVAGAARHLARLTGSVAAAPGNRSPLFKQRPGRVTQATDRSLPRIPGRNPAQTIRAPQRGTTRGPLVRPETVTAAPISCPNQADNLLKPGHAT